jgi:CBS domain containing-hemolysin-like protein
MTPRVVVSTADENISVADYFNQNKTSSFSRVPVYSKNPDNITGYIIKEDILKSIAEDKRSRKLSELKRKILIVNSGIAIPLLFQKFIEEKEHISIIVDEFGSFLGVVTMEDVIETLLGLEIMDEQDTHSDMQQLARKKWKERAKKYGLIEDDQEREL